MTTPNPLTPEELAAIDAAIAAGKIQHIPLGTFSACATETIPLREQIRRTANAGKARNRAVAEAAAERAAKAMMLREEGLPTAEIAERLGLSVSTVNKYFEHVRGASS